MKTLFPLNLPPNRPSNRHPSKGSTIFEVILYLALFAIIFSTVTSAYFLIVKHAAKLQESKQKAELHFLMYEIVQYKSDHAQNGTIYTPKKEDFARILKYYPAFNLNQFSYSFTGDAKFRTYFLEIFYTFELDKSDRESNENESEYEHIRIKLNKY